MAQRCSACPSDVDGVMWPKLPDLCVCHDNAQLRERFLAARAALEQQQREAASDAERAAAERFMHMRARGAFLRRVRAWQAEWADSARQQQRQHQRTQRQAGHGGMPMPGAVAPPGGAPRSGPGGFPASGPPGAASPSRCRSAPAPGATATGSPRLACLSTVPCGTITLPCLRCWRGLQLNLK